MIFFLNIMPAFWRIQTLKHKPNWRTETCGELGRRLGGSSTRSFFYSAWQTAGTAANARRILSEHPKVGGEQTKP